MDEGTGTEVRIRAIREGNAELYADAIRQFQQPLFEYCYYLLMHKEEAEDAVQEAFIRAYEKLDTCYEDTYKICYTWIST